MIRLWLGVALLSGSWLFGLSYVQPANSWVWIVCVLAGAGCLAGAPRFSTDRRQLAWAAACLLPAALLLPWPYRAAPLLLAAGLAVQLISLPVAWPKAVGRGAAWAGVILLIQAVLLEAYQYQTARCHDLPAPLAWLAAALLRMLGVDAVANLQTANGAAIGVWADGGSHRVGATWELFLDPATLAFAVGGFVLLGLWAAGEIPRGRRWTAWLAAGRWLAVVLALWLPLRLMVWMSIFLHRALLDQSNVASATANQFVSAWPYVLLLLGPMCLAAVMVRLGKRADVGDTSESADEPPDLALDGALEINLPSRLREGRAKSPGRAQDSRPLRPFEANPPRERVLTGTSRRHRAATLLLIGAATAVFTFWWLWSPVGARRGGRVRIVERHSTWEPTTRAYDTEWYGEYASYNYAAAYRYLSQYFEMSRLLEDDAVDDAGLADCDILVIKIPTARFEPDEVDAIVRFVDRGGGLLLIGDHTNVFNCGTYLNDIARPFGFLFRNDLLFRVGSAYKQRYDRPLVPHPAVQHVPWMDFAVSCSIDPGNSRGEMVMRSTGLWNLPSDYNASNYHPQAEYRPEMQWGAFCQIWTTTHGGGRVLAFSDSTLFSNFCVFQEGKAEMLRSMIEYLNRGTALDRIWNGPYVSVLALTIVGALLAVAWWLARGTGPFWGLSFAAGVLGWTVAAFAVIAIHHRQSPEPPVERPLMHVVVDRTLSDVPLSHGAFPQGDGFGYGLFEQWISRLGNFTSRGTGSDVFAGDALVIIEPNHSVSRRYRDALVRFVEAGGHVLILDSPDNAATSSNSLLAPFGIVLAHAGSRPGVLQFFDGWPGVELDAGSQIIGGEPIATIGEMPVAAQVKYGRGTVTVVGCGYIFRDVNMGENWMLDPDEQTRFWYRMTFALLEAGLNGTPPDPKWQRPGDPPATTGTAAEAEASAPPE